MPQSQTSSEITIAYLSWINERLREEIQKRETAESDRKKGRMSLTKIVSAFSASVMALAWLMHS